jgi:ribonuclease P protein component
MSPPGPPASRRFGQDQRLRRRGEFQTVFDKGQRIQGRFFTLLVLRNEKPGSRLGIVASRKLGDSVRRNRAKRLIRELFRHNSHLTEPAGFDVVVIPRGELFKVGYATLETDFRAVLARGASRLAKHGRS